MASRESLSITVARATRRARAALRRASLGQRRGGIRLRCCASRACRHRAYQENSISAPAPLCLPSHTPSLMPLSTHTTCLRPVKLCSSLDTGAVTERWTGSLPYWRSASHNMLTLPHTTARALACLACPLSAHWTAPPPCCLPMPAHSPSRLAAGCLQLNGGTLRHGVAGNAGAAGGSSHTALLSHISAHTPLPLPITRISPASGRSHGVDGGRI